MGQTYDVYLTLKYKDQKKVVEKIKEFINENQGKGIRFSIENKNLNKLTECIKVILTNRDYSENKEKDGSYHESHFDASYGWRNVMLKAFEALSPAIEDGSGILIYPDSESYGARKEKGKIVFE